MAEEPSDAESEAGSGEGGSDINQLLGQVSKESSPEEKELLKGKSGCGRAFMVLAILLLVAAAGAAAMFANQDPKEICSSSTRKLDGERVELLAFAGGDECDDDGDTSDDTTTTTEEEASDGGGAAGGAPPPAEGDLPPGAILFQGTSGDNIGYIYQDGAIRFVAIDAPGVAVGEAAGSSIATAIGQDGKVVSFGATLNIDPNPGAYGMALFRNAPASTSPYLAGCSMPIGQSSCQSDTPGAPVKAGDKVTISVGEAGNAPANGSYTFDWWFVFQPD